MKTISIRLAEKNQKTGRKITLYRGRYVAREDVFLNNGYQAVTVKRCIGCGVKFGSGSHVASLMLRAGHTFSMACPTCNAIN